LPGIKLTPADVASSFAGLRALVTAGGHRGTPSSVKREEVILHSRSGLITVAGGKLTTHREIAQKLVDLVMKQLGRPTGKCPTLTTPFPGARPLAANQITSRDGALLRSLPAEIGTILTARYGTRAAIPARLAAERSDLAAPLSHGCPAIGAEVVHAVRSEMVLSLDDFMVRRTSLSWRYPVEAEAAASAAARIMATELGWDRTREADELATFTREQKRNRATA
jgi:glycerol-3-phosphate dehydrogenase